MMKARKVLLPALATFLVVMIAFNGCKKKEDAPAIAAAQDHATAENLFSDLYKVVEDASESTEDEINSGGKKSMLFDGCPAVTIVPFDAVTWPKTITIDFGTENCLGNDGKLRRGIVTAVTTGWYRDSSTVITVTPQDFYVNDHKVEGLKTITNNGRDNNGFLNYTVNVENATVTRPEGDSFTWQSTRTNTWVEGEETLWPQILDDVYLISGNASGTTSAGTNYDINITEDLRVEIGCKWVVSGVIEVVPEGLEPRVLDYGNGGCDANATVSVAGWVFNIVLP